jgi:predicted Zn-dependent protease
MRSRCATRRAERDEPGLRLCRAVALFVGGESEAAAREVDAVLAAHPERLAARAVKAQILARSGDRAGAIAVLRGLVDRYPDYPAAMGLLSTLLLPGPHYREVVREIHEKLRPRT